MHLLVHKIRQLSVQETLMYAKAIELGVLKCLGPDIFREGGIVSVNCGDENINHDRSSYLVRKHNDLVRHRLGSAIGEISEDSVSLYIHSHCWNGGGMILSKLPQEVKDYNIKDIQATLILKNRKTIAPEGHWPCGKADLSGIDMLQSLSNLFDSIMLLKKSLGSTFREVSVYGLYTVSVNNGSCVKNFTHQFDEHKLVEHFEELQEFWEEIHKNPTRELAEVA